MENPLPKQWYNFGYARGYIAIAPYVSKPNPLAIKRFIYKNKLRSDILNLLLLYAKERFIKRCLRYELRKRKTVLFERFLFAIENSSEEQLEKYGRYEDFLEGLEDACRKYFDKHYMRFYEN